MALLLRSRTSYAQSVVSSLLKSSNKFATGSPKKCSHSVSRFSSLVEVRCLVTMMPLYSAVASSRLISALSSESQTWGRVPLGLSMPL